MPHCSNLEKRMYLDTFFSYLTQILESKVFYDCSSNIREEWFPRLYTRAKLFILELADNTSSVNSSLNKLIVTNQKFLSAYDLFLRIYSGNFNAITINPLSSVGVEVRFQFYYTISIGRSPSHLSDDSLSDRLISIFNKSLPIDPNPHLHSAFLDQYII